MKIDEGMSESGVPELYYTFKSPKTHKIYQVHIEMHPNHFYAIKFHLKDHKNHSKKYNILTNLHEARPVIFTCIKIMLEINEKDPRSSFGFIGSNTLFSTKTENGKIEYTPQNEDKCNTRRYRVYKRIMLTFFSENEFEHNFNEEYSTYILVRQSELETTPNLIKEISNYFTSNYSNFGESRL